MHIYIYFFPTSSKSDSQHHFSFNLISFPYRKFSIKSSTLSRSLRYLDRDRVFIPFVSWIIEIFLNLLVLLLVIYICFYYIFPVFVFFHSSSCFIYPYSVSLMTFLSFFCLFVRFVSFFLTFQ